MSEYRACRSRSSWLCSKLSPRVLRTFPKPASSTMELGDCYSIRCPASDKTRGLYESPTASKKMGHKGSEKPKTWKVRSRFHRAKKPKTARSSWAKTKGENTEEEPPTRWKIISPNQSEDDAWPRDFCRQQENELRWKMFTDAEYIDWKAFKDNDCQVPLRSVFSYLKVQLHPVAIGNAPRKKAVPSVLADMVKGNHGAYVRIKIGQQRFQCIPSLLKCYSVWFANRDWRMTRFKFLEREVPARGFAALYDWMRTEQMPAFNVAVATLQAARRLRVPLLEKDCWQLLSTDEVREKRAFLVFLEAKELPALGEVCEAMLGRLRNYFLALVGSPEYLDLEVNVLEVLLRQDAIGVNSEMEVFFAVLRWLGHPVEPTRLPYMRRLMNCVRFNHMPMTFLFSLRESINRPDKDELFRPDPVLLAFNRDPETMASLEQAMSFIGVRCQYDDTEEFLAVCEDHSIGVVFPRQWVYHPNCPYHLSRLSFPYQHRFTVTEFTEYVTSIQETWAGEGPADHGKTLVLDMVKDPLLCRQNGWDG
ncbi:uncharacterized protein LOC108023201 [Drosophila biarmipes]|uniref:uncharacterized protein LOC108023201 n=1 Tax=Drosophila biarmipes TaxID=125945 RepID=UPI0021CC69D2|nr:uncharacterized protein LOC108023201 [Drosophila biarmipes]